MPAVRMLGLALCVTLSVAVSGCKKPETAVNVDVHGVNYSSNEFFYSVIDPDKPGKFSGVGEHIGPFAGGGTTCCFTLPKTWKPGIKVHLWTRHWLPRLPDGTLPEVEGTSIVEVPQYADGQPGELWVIRSQEGTFSVVSSNYQPDHPKWPGKIKGWPVPSIEFQREQWELYRKHEEDNVTLYEDLLSELANTPETRAREAWNYAQEHDPHSLEGFDAYDDPRYLSALKRRYEAGRLRSKDRLKQVLEARP